MDVIEIRPVRDRIELDVVFDLLGAQFPEPMDTNDRRFDDLAAHFPADQRLMVVATAEEALVGGALAFRHNLRSMTLRIIAVAQGFRHRGLGRRLVERVEIEARLLGVESVGLGTDEALEFWFHLGYTPTLLLQWVYDSELFEPECQTILDGPLEGLHHWRSSFNGIPQLLVNLEEPRLDLRHAVGEMVVGCHVGFLMSKKLPG